MSKIGPSMVKQEDPWHEGEHRLQKHLQIEDIMHKRGEIAVRDFMPDQHRDFFRYLPFVVLSALDSKGQVWTFVRAKSAGFIQSPTATRLTIDSEALAAEPDDLMLGPGSKISVLGIDFNTRRRNRLNGTIAYSNDNRLDIEVDQSYGNCPRYIHVREQLRTPQDQKVGQVEKREELNESDMDFIGSVDMLFISSRALELNHESRSAGIDVNHRGGDPGFVTVVDKQHFVIPDYHGNNFFNTYGNILLDSRASVLFLNALTGETLTVAGQAKVILDDLDNAERYGSARYISLEIESIRRAAGNFPLRYKRVESNESS